MKLTGILGCASLAVLAMAGNARAGDKCVVGFSKTLIGNGTSIFGGLGGYGGIIGALILTVLIGLLTLLDVSEPIKQILYGAIILSLAAAYARLTD